MKTMRRRILILMVTFLALMLTLTIWGVVSMERETNERENYVGEEIIIQKDTLVLTNYVWWSESYDTNKGTKVGAEFVENYFNEEK
jgi:hypothetical protein